MVRKTYESDQAVLDSSFVDHNRVKGGFQAAGLVEFLGEDIHDFLS